MTRKKVKRGFNFSPELLQAWEEFHAPSKDYSPSAAAAFLLYMVVEPKVRERLRKLADTADMKRARTAARKILRQTIVDAYFSGFTFSDADREILREYAKQALQKISQTK